MGCLLKANGLYARTTIGAVLLATDATAVLELGGVPLVMRQLIALSGAGVDEVAVVLGGHADAVEAAVRAFPITLVRAASPDDARAASVRSGLRALSPRLDALIVARADQPMIDAQDIVALIGAFKKRGGAAMVVPRVAVDGGTPAAAHPVIFDSALRDEWLAGDADLDSAAWRDANAARVLWFDTDNRRYATTVGTAQERERFTERTGHRLHWPPALEASTTP